MSIIHYKLLNNLNMKTILVSMLILLSISAYSEKKVKLFNGKNLNNWDLFVNDNSSNEKLSLNYIIEPTVGWGECALQGQFAEWVTLGGKVVNFKMIGSSTNIFLLSAGDKIGIICILRNCLLQSVFTRCTVSNLIDVAWFIQMSCSCLS